MQRLNFCNQGSVDGFLAHGGTALGTASADFNIFSSSRRRHIFVRNFDIRLEHF